MHPKFGIASQRRIAGGDVGIARLILLAHILLIFIGCGLLAPHSPLMAGKRSGVARGDLLRFADEFLQFVSISLREFALVVLFH